MTDPSPVIFGVLMTLILSALVTLAYFIWEDSRYISVPANGYSCQMARTSNNESAICTMAGAMRLRGYKMSLGYENLGGKTVSLFFEKSSP